MPLFNNHITVQLFVAICSIIKIAYSDNYEEYTECMRQIELAFGNNKSSSGCLKHAIQYYKEGQKLPIPKKNLPAPEKIPVKSSNENRIVAKEPVKVTNFQDLMSNSQTVSHSRGPEPVPINPQNISTQDKNFTIKTQDASIQQKDVINYAELYHKALKTMIHGSGVPRREVFCNKFYKNEQSICYKALSSFGPSAMSAVREAFSSYTLDYCDVFQVIDRDFVYIHKYMQIIIDNCVAKNPSKRPELFCEEVTYKNVLYKNLSYHLVNKN